MHREQLYCSMGKFTVLYPWYRSTMKSLTSSNDVLLFNLGESSIAKGSNGHSLRRKCFTYIAKECNLVRRIAVGFSISDGLVEESEEMHWKYHVCYAFVAKQLLIEKHEVCFSLCGNIAIIRLIKKLEVLLQLVWQHCNHLDTLRCLWCHASRDKSVQAFPRFSYCKRQKLGMEAWERGYVTLAYKNS